MSGTGTKFLASALLALNLMPAELGSAALASSNSIPRARQTVSRFVTDAYGNPQEPVQAPEQQEQAAAQTVTPTVTGTPQSSTDTELDMAIARRRVNERLLQQAQDDFERLATLSEDGYSRSLLTLQASLNSYLSENNPNSAGAVFMDPKKFDTGLALGFTPKDATEKILGLQRVTVPDDILKNVAGSMKSSDGSKFAATNAFTQDPSAHMADDPLAPQVCVLVPTSAYAPEFQIKGLSYDENIDFINRHEGWHCKNTKYNFAGIPKEVPQGIDTSNLQNYIGNEQAMKTITISNKRESLSDTGAAGDMIRAGADLGLIEKLQADRYESRTDYLHWTASSLGGLKDEINKMGVESFRKLNDADARKLYEGVVDKNTYSPEAAEIILNYSTRATDEDRAAMRDWKANFPLMETLMKSAAAVYDDADPKTLDDTIGKTGDDKTKKALTVLRDQINELGVEKFRAMSDDDALKIATALHDEGGALSDIGANVVGYARLNAADRAAADKSIADTKAATPAAFEIMKPYGEPPTDEEKALAKTKLPEDKPLTDDERKVFQDLAAWNATQMLQDNAFAKDGKITPATLITAYGRMQDELHANLVEHPDDPLLRAKVTKLQQSFITSVHNTDYVDVNFQRGVNIFDVEPSLSKAPAEKKLTQEPALAVQPDDDKSPETPKAPMPQTARRLPVPGV